MIMIKKMYRSNENYHFDNYISTDRKKIKFNRASVISLNSGGHCETINWH